MNTLFWLRDEVKVGEHRTALTPTGAKALIDAGAQVIVERSDTRIFPDQAYVDVAVSWRQAIAGLTHRSTPIFWV